jgi:hypothetical protein
MLKSIAVWELHGSNKTRNSLEFQIAKITKIDSKSHYELENTSDQKKISNKNFDLELRLMPIF